MTEPAVLVLRPDDAFSARLREGGFEVVNLELIKTEPLRDLGDLQRKLAVIGKFDGLFFTSPVAAEVYLKEMSGFNGSFLGKIYVLGERTKRVFENSGINVEYDGDVNTAEELIGSLALSEFAGKNLLFVRGDKSMRTIPEMIGETAEVDEVIVYRTRYSEPEAEIIDGIRTRLGRGEIGWVCFFSPSGVESFRRCFDREDLSGVKTAAIGQTTALKAEASGLEVNFVSPRAAAEDFAAGMIEHIKEH